MCIRRDSGIRSFLRGWSRGWALLTEVVLPVRVRLQQIADQRDVVTRRPHEANSLQECKTRLVSPRGLLRKVPRLERTFVP